MFKYGPFSPPRDDTGPIYSTFFLQYLYCNISNKEYKAASWKNGNVESVSLLWAWPTIFDLELRPAFTCMFHHSYRSLA